jgi:biotin carboxyl carrier protein
MKFKIQQKGDDKAWYFEVGDHVLAQNLTPGQIFKAKMLDENSNSHGEIDVRIHPDGRSISVGQFVVPFSGLAQTLKGSDARMKLGAPATFRRISIEQVKPIVPAKTVTNLGGGEQKSPLTGKVLTLFVSEGQKVREGDVIMTIEAMKMENRILADCNGLIQNIRVSPGTNVSVGEALCFLKPETEENGK